MYEWARGPEESLDAFRIRKGLASAHFYKVVKAMDWKGTREKLKAQAVAKVESRIVTDLSKRYSFQEKQWLTVEGIVARALKKLALSDADNFSPEALESVTRSLERALKARKLIVGEKTGDEPPASSSGAPGTFTHAQVVGLIEAMQSRDSRIVIPEAVLDAELVTDSEVPGPGLGCEEDGIEGSGT